MGEADADSLGAEDVTFLRGVAGEFPSHRFSIESNEDGMEWAVFEPAVSSPGILKFTICRIDPSVIVMIEDRSANRWFRSVLNIEGAAKLVRNASDNAIFEAAGAHPTWPVVQ